MQFHGHDDVSERLRRMLTSGRLASSYLFVGPAGVGKCTLAHEFARVLLCPSANLDAFAPCGRCDSCLAWNENTHPDLEYVFLPTNDTSLKISLFIGDRDHRYREGLCNRIALKPSLGPRRVAIIDDADHLGLESANCLLKTLEEPPPGTVFVLIGTSPSKQLPTIRSRCQIVRFRPLSVDVVAELLVSAGHVENQEAARRLAASSDGSLLRATQLADPDLHQFCARLVPQLRVGSIPPAGLANDMQDFISAAGRESAARRARLEAVIEAVVTSYREQLRALVAASEHMKTNTAQQVERKASLDLLITRLDRSLRALDELHRNANPSALVGCWLDDVARAQ